MISYNEFMKFLVCKAGGCGVCSQCEFGQEEFCLINLDSKVAFKLYKFILSHPVPSAFYANNYDVLIGFYFLEDDKYV